MPIVSDLIVTHLADEGVAPGHLTRLWLHQANMGMNDLIGTTCSAASRNTANAIILQDYANTSSAGSIIAFSQYPLTIWLPAASASSARLEQDIRWEA